MPEQENVLRLDLRPASAECIMREIVGAYDGRVFFTQHAEQKMVERGITRRQVYCCLANGRITEGPARSVNGNWEMRLEVVSAGDVLNVVAALENDGNGNFVIVITTYKS